MSSFANLIKFEKGFIIRWFHKNKKASYFALLVASFLAFFLILHAHAQRQPFEAVPKADRARVQQLRQAFKGQHGAGWKLECEPRTNLPRIIRGGQTRAYPGTPEEAANAFVEDHRALIGLDTPHATLRSLDVRPISRDQTRAVFQQQYRGLDVFDARLIVVLDSQQRVTYLASSVWNVQELDVAPSLSREEALERIRRAVAADSLAMLEDPKLVVCAQGAGQLAYLILVRVGSHPSFPCRYLVDAHTGAILLATPLVQEVESEPKDESAKIKKRVDKGPVPPPFFLQDWTAPCDREWTTISPTGEVQVTPIETPPDSYKVQINLATASFGAAEGDAQAEGLYAAGIKLLPGKEYRIRFSWDLSTWDSYTAQCLCQPEGGDCLNGFWDLFFLNVNSSDFAWSFMPSPPLGDSACAPIFSESGGVLPGKTWLSGGDCWGEGHLCTSTGSFEFTYRENDPTKTVYLSVGLDTGMSGSLGYGHEWERGWAAGSLA